MNIETVYRVRVYFDVTGTPDDCRVIQQIADNALTFGRKLNECSANTGGPCWAPYILAEHKSKAPLLAFVGKLERYINRRKGARIIP